ncbi:sulfur carrier protein ThiS [bacterium]|nr:sulfur carrier protein ThiS [bacterium]
MKIILQGQSEEVPEGLTVAELLVRLKIESDLVAVERNQSVVPRREFPQCRLAPGDQIEIVTLVGGG